MDLSSGERKPYLHVWQILAYFTTWVENIAHLSLLKSPLVELRRSIKQAVYQEEIYFVVLVSNLNIL